MEVVQDNPSLKYYEYLKSNGADVAPTYESFVNTMSDPSTAQKYHQYLVKENFDAPDNYNSWAKSLSVGEYAVKKKDDTLPSGSEASSSNILATEPPPEVLGLPSEQPVTGNISPQQYEELAKVDFLANANLDPEHIRAKAQDKQTEAAIEKANLQEVLGGNKYQTPQQEADRIDPVKNMTTTAWKVLTKDIPSAFSSLTALSHELAAERAENKPEYQKELRGYRDNALQVAQKLQAEGAKLSENTINEIGKIENPWDAFIWATNAATQAGIQIPAAVATGGGSSVVQEVGSVYLDGVQRIAAEKGITPQQVIDQDLDEPIVAMTFGISAALLDRIGAGQVLKGPAKEAFKSALKQRGMQMLKAGATEGGTEYTQTWLEQIGSQYGGGKGFTEALKKVATDETLRKERTEAFAQGLVGGTSLGGVGGGGDGKGTEMFADLNNRVKAPTGDLGKGQPKVEPKAEKKAEPEVKKEPIVTPPPKEKPVEVKVEPKEKVEDKPAPEVKVAKKEEEKTFTTHTGENVSGEKLTKALNKVADWYADNAKKVREEDAYAKHVTEKQKDENLQKGLERAEEIRRGEYIDNFTIQQRINTELTGEAVPLLSDKKAVEEPVKPEVKEEVKEEPVVKEKSVKPEKTKKPVGELDMPSNLSDDEASNWVQKTYGLSMYGSAKKWVKTNGYDPSVKERGDQKIGDKVKFRASEKANQVSGEIIGFSKDRYHTTFIKMSDGSTKLVEGAFLDKIESPKKEVSATQEAVKVEKPTVKSEIVEDAIEEKVEEVTKKALKLPVDKKAQDNKLKEQKKDLVSQMTEVRDLLWKPGEKQTDNYEMDSRIEEVKKLGYEVTDKGQIIFKIKDDGVLKIHHNSINDAVETTKKDFPEKVDEKTAIKIKSDGRPNVRDQALSRGSLDRSAKTLQNAKDNLKNAKAAGNKKLADVFAKDVEKEEKIFKEAEKIDWDHEADRKEMDQNEEAQAWVKEHEQSTDKPYFRKLGYYGFSADDFRIAKNNKLLDKGYSFAEVKARLEAIEAKLSPEEFKKKLEQERFKAQFDLEAKFLKKSGVGYRQPKNNSEEVEFNRFQNVINSNEEKIRILSKPESKKVTSKKNKKSRNIDVYHGGDVVEITAASKDRPLFVSEDESQASEYTKENKGKVTSFKANDSAIANESKVYEIIERLGLKPKEEGWDANELNVFELIDPKFETSLSEKDIKKVFSELEKEGYGGVRFTDTNLKTLKQDIDNIAIFNADLLKPDGGDIKQDTAEPSADESIGNEVKSEKPVDTGTDQAPDTSEKATVVEDKLSIAKKKLQEAKERAKAIRKAQNTNLAAVKDNFKDAKERAKADRVLFDAYVDVAKEYIASGVKSVEDFAKEIGEEVSEVIKSAWDVASGKVKKTIATKRAYEGAIREGVKSEMERIGLTREIENQKEAKAKAKELVKSIGSERALNAVRKGDVQGASAAYIWNAVLESTDRKIAKATSPEEVVRLEKIQAELFNEFSQKALEGGRFASALGDIYKNSNISYNLQAKIQQYKDLPGNNGQIPADVEARFRKYDQELKDLKAKIADYEKKTGSKEGAQAVEAIKETVERKKKNIKISAKVLANKIRSGKTALRPGVFYSSAIPGGPIIWNGALEVAAVTIEAGGTVAQAVADGIAFIKKSKWYGNLTNEKKEEAEKAFAGHLNDTSAPEEDSDIRIPNKMIRDLVERGIDNINDLVKEVKKKLKSQYPDITDREVRDAITQYGKISNMSQDEINIQIRRMKRIGKLISALEDVQKKIRPLRSGLQRDQLTAEERALNKQLREEIKDLPVDDTTLANQQRSALDAAKKRVSNQIDDYNREIATGEQVAKSTRTVKQDEELKALIEQRDALKKIHEGIFYSKEDDDAQKLKSAVRAVEKNIETLERRIKEGDLSPKKSTPVVSAELSALRENRNKLKTVLKQLQDDAGITEEKRLEMTKKRVSSRIADFERRLKEGDFSKRQVKAKVIADDELVKLNAERIRIQEKYDKEFYKNKLENRSKWQKRRDALWEVWGLTRALRATGEFSFILIQGGIQTIAHPLHAAKAITNALKFFSSESRTEKWLNTVKAQDWYPTMKGSKLALTEQHAELTAREELFYSGWTNIVWNAIGSPLKFSSNPKAFERWVAANPFKALERAAIGYLDTIRVMRFMDGMDILEQKGKTFENSPQDYKDVADAINTLTGRASIGRLEQVSDVLSKVFFSPRNWASVIKTATPYALYHFGKMTPTGRKMAIYDFSKFIGLTTSFVALAAAALNNDDDDETGVEFDPRSSDFMKIRIGDTRIDPWGGRIQMIVLMSKIIMDSTKNAKGEIIPLGTPYKSDTRNELLITMATNKLAPSASILNKYLTTRMKKVKNPETGEKEMKRVTKFGEEYSLSDEVTSNLYPIYWETLSELYKDDPSALNGVLAFYSFLGGGVSVYAKKEKEEPKKGNFKNSF